MGSQIIYDFTKESNTQNWRIVDDVVMGGKSSGRLSKNQEGFGVFSGDISLDNNGGFSSLRYRFDKIGIEGYTKIRIRLKGDGKSYQFRVKPDSRNYYSYIAPFVTSGEWQTIEISLKEMYPAFRGKKLNQSNFSSSNIEELAFLIGNKKVEYFKLTIDKISLE